MDKSSLFSMEVEKCSIMSDVADDRIIEHPDEKKRIIIQIKTNKV